jgi:methionyl-tRNA formyltransferase
LNSTYSRPSPNNAKITDMKIIFFGNECLATACTTKLPILTKLKSDGHTIELIVINQSDTKSRNKQESEIVTFAKNHNIPLYIFEDTQKLLAKLNSTKSEVAVLAAFGKIIKQEVINHFKLGIINLHPSLLPKYRGPTPIESAILNGDSETGVSIMALTSGMDSGPIYQQTKLKLSGKEAKQELANKLGTLGAAEVSKLLSLIDSPRGNKAELPKPTEQTGQPTVCNLIQKSDSILDLTKPAEVSEREVRAHLGWPGSKTTLKLKNGQELQITITAAIISPLPWEGSDLSEGGVILKNNPLLLKTPKKLPPNH